MTGQRQIAAARAAGAMAALVMTLAVVLLATVFGATSRAAPLPNGTTRFPATMISDAAPVRQALIVAPSGNGAGLADARSALLGNDAEAYRDLLRLLGFDVTLVVADSRPDLDAAMRGFAASVRRDADVSVFLLGNIIPFENTLYLTPSGASLPAGADAGMLATEGLRVGDVLRRIMDQAPRDIALVVDRCVPADVTTTCPTGTTALPEGVSGILAQPRQAGRGAPDAAASIREDLLPLMQQEGLPLHQLYSMLADGLDGSGVAILGTPSLSRRFSFLPVDFLQRLPLACNSVDPRLGADGLRARASLEPVVADCAMAASQYSFSPLFRTNLTVVREQRAAQIALADCTDAADSYLAQYPRGIYRSAVLEQQTKCRQAVSPPAEACAGTVTESNGLITLALRDPARALMSTPVTVDNITYTTHFDAEGMVSFLAPIFHAQADVGWTDADGRACRRQGVRFAKFDTTYRVAIVWTGAFRLSLHVVEPPDGRLGGPVEYVYGGRPNLDGASGLGSLQHFGDPAAATSQVELYTLVKQKPERGYFLFLTAFSGRGNPAVAPYCGKEPNEAARYTIYAAALGITTKRNIILNQVPCGTIWDERNSDSGYYQKFSQDW